jgi:hypothetical protein
MGDVSADSRGGGKARPQGRAGIGEVRELSRAASRAVRVSATGSAGAADEVH